MHNITLIFTRHEELGQCNIDELYNIIEKINPEIIFEEIPPSYFEKYYLNKTHRNLETSTINNYLKKYNIKHIPVDSDNIPPESFFNNLKYMYERVEGLTDINGYNYRTLIDANRMNIAVDGFRYLNSFDCIILQDKITDAVEKALQIMNNEKLNDIYKLWNQINEERENIMIQNIFEYSKQFVYNKAVLTIGSAHRRSIIEKIEEYKKKESLKLSWSFYTE